MTWKRVPASKIFSSKWKIEETIEDIEQGRLSQSSGAPLVAKFSNRSGYVLVDGHHRVLEEHPLNEVWVEVQDWKYRADSSVEFMSVKQARKLRG